jgi:hypoxanthine phosphoribosyltransferase
MKYSKKLFDDDMRALKLQIRRDKHDLIIGLNRGGCILAVCLSHALKIPCTMIDASHRDGANISPSDFRVYFKDVAMEYSRILIVDDLWDSGDTIKEIVEYASSYAEVSVATLLFNTDKFMDLASIGIENHYFARSFSRSSQPKYIDFWWEQY